MSNEFDPEFDKLLDRATTKEGWDSLTKAEQGKIADAMGFYWDEKTQDYIPADGWNEDRDVLGGDAERIDTLQYALDLAIDALAGIYEETGNGLPALTTIAIVLTANEYNLLDIIQQARERIEAR